MVFLHFLFASDLFCLHPIFFVCILSVLFASCRFCLHLIFFVCSKPFFIALTLVGHCRIPPSPRLNRVKGALFPDEANLTIDSHPLNRLHSWILESSICQRFQSFILTLSNQALLKRNDLTKMSLVKLNFAILTAQVKQDHKFKIIPFYSSFDISIKFLFKF